MSGTLPTRWDLSNVYPGLDSTQLSEDIQKLKDLLDEFETYFSNQVSGVQDNGDTAQIADVISHLVKRLNQLLELSGTVRAYIQSFVATDSFNQPARRLLSQFDLVSLRLQKLSVRVESWLGKLLPQLPKILLHTGAAQEHAFFIMETAQQSKYLMGESEEMLAAELNLSGATAWAKLQGTITSQLSVDFELDGKIQKLSMPALINLHSHPDVSIRRRAYETELVAWESAREPLAAAMNSIKGTVNTLYRRRNREDALHESIDNARIDRPTLDAMLSAMHDSFPMFRGYFKTKANRLGKEKLAWWDIFAPVGENKRTYTFADGREFILKHFARFSPELSSMAEYAFDHNWIDAEQRVGKRGGAFCMGVPGVKESRILCNFDGTLDQVSTIAHELGHAFHNYCMFKAGRTPLQRTTPMTLAETASIMCETIIVEAALAEAGSRDEELAILETSLIGHAQVIVDIYSRYLFEKEVFERREKAELSADELNEIMENAQKATYGDGLDERYLHKFMWTWKPHYYSAGRSFYNYPYAFGLLFGLGLYAIYQQRGEAFVQDYMALLASTGESNAADLAQEFGIDIRQKSFWETSLKTIGRQIERYNAI